MLQRCRVIITGETRAAFVQIELINQRARREYIKLVIDKKTKLAAQVCTKVGSLIIKLRVINDVQI